MTTKTDGGAAFPVADHPSLSVDPGMSLRDYFAAKAMQAVLPTINEFPDEHWRIGVAMDSYAMADAMLIARENKS